MYFMHAIKGSFRAYKVTSQNESSIKKPKYIYLGLDVDFDLGGVESWEIGHSKA